MVKRKSKSRSKSYRGRRQRGGFFAPKVQILDEEGRKKVDAAKKGFLSGLSAIGKKTSDSLAAAKSNIISAKNKVASVSSAVGSKIGEVGSAGVHGVQKWNTKRQLESQDKAAYKKDLDKRAEEALALQKAAKQASDAAKKANIIATAIAGGGRRKSRRSKSRSKSRKRRSSRKRHSKSKSHKRRRSSRKRNSKSHKKRRSSRKRSKRSRH